MAEIENFTTAGQSGYIADRKTQSAVIRQRQAQRLGGLQVDGHSASQLVPRHDLHALDHVAVPPAVHTSTGAAAAAPAYRCQRWQACNQSGENVLPDLISTACR